MTTAKTHQSCPDCGHHKCLTVNEDGSSYCFSCGVRGKPTAEWQGVTYEHRPETKKQFNAKLLTGKYSAIIDRRIQKETAEKYSAIVDGDRVLFGYYDEGNEPVAAKVRYPDKRFVTEGDWTKGRLFGQQLFSAGGRYITITEGEYDCMAAYQMFGSKYPVVSVRNGAQAAIKDCRNQFEYLNSFENVIICFDSDEPGQKAATDVAELFGNKAKIMRMSDGKDANEYLLNAKADVFVKQWWDAEVFTPDGIVRPSELLAAIKVPLRRGLTSYPFRQLDNMLYGIRPAELVTLCAGSGLGKSTILRELVVAMLKQDKDGCMGLMFLEETPERTLRGLVGLEMNKPIHLPDCEYSPEEVDRVYHATNYENRVFFWDAFGSNEIERVLGRMRYMVKGLGCQFIVLDHLSILVSDQQNGDERKAIDMIMTKLRMFVQEMRITLLLVSHLKRPDGKSLEDGAATSLGMLRGSAAIAQLSDAVIGAERNSQAEDEEERNTTKLRVLKNRFSGKTGPAGRLVYNEDTGRLTEEENAL